MKKHYFFRDINHQDNLKDGKTYHSAGIVDKIYSEEQIPSGKEVAVTFIEPFQGTITSEWRAHADVQLFEVDEWEWRMLHDVYRVIKSAVEK
jgi:hypothetical protein